MSGGNISRRGIERSLIEYHFQGHFLFSGGIKQNIKASVPFVEEAIGPLVNAAIAIDFGGDDDRCIGCELMLEEMQGHIIWLETSSMNSNPNTVKNVIAMGFDNKLNADVRSSRDQFSHLSLAFRMQVCFGILNE